MIVGAALRGRPSVECDAGAATECRPYSSTEMIQIAWICYI